MSSPVETLGQVASLNASLLLLLGDTEVVKKWSGAEGEDAERVLALADAKGFAGIGRLPLEGGTGFILQLEAESGYAGVYRLGLDRIALFGPGHEYFEENAEDDATIPKDATARLLSLIAKGPSPAAKLAGSFALASGGLVVTEHNQSGKAAQRALKKLKSVKELDDETGSLLVRLPPGDYAILVERTGLPWDKKADASIAFVVPATDEASRTAKAAKVLDEVARPAKAKPEAPAEQDFYVEDEGVFLNLVRREYTKLPDRVRTYPNVRRLYAYANAIAEIPSWIGELLELRELNLYQNALVALPPEIGRLSELEQLVLGKNMLTELPSWVGDLRKLKLISLEANKKISELPSGLWTLPELTFLDLSGTGVKELPDAVLGLKNLEELNVRNSKITRLPAALTKLPRLLHLYAGKKVEIPPELAAMETEAGNKVVKQY